jgi:tellurite resistance protein TerC
MRWVLQNGIKLARVVAGAALLLIGCGLLFLPGPGIPLMLVGLTILAVDFVWARRLKKRLQDKAMEMVEKVRTGTPPVGGNGVPKS